VQADDGVTGNAEVRRLEERVRGLGPLNQITDQAAQVIRAGVPEGGFRLVAGTNRLAAARLPGWKTVDARVVDLPDGGARQRSTERTDPRRLVRKPLGRPWPLAVACGLSDGRRPCPAPGSLNRSVAEPSARACERAQREVTCGWTI
jgi:hypothetical protein